MIHRLLNLLFKILIGVAWIIVIMTVAQWMAREAHRYYIGEYVKKECLR